MKKLNSILLLSGLLFCFSAYSQNWSHWRGENRDGNVSGFKAPKSWPSELQQAWKINVGLGDASPVLQGNKLYVFARQGAEEVLYCLDAKTGKEIWSDRYNGGEVTGPSASLHTGPRSTPELGEGKIVTLGVGGTLSCLDAVTGKVLWRKENTSKIVPQFYIGMSPLIIDKMVIAHLGGKGSGTIAAYDLMTGNEKWNWSGDGPAYSSPAIMSIDGIKQAVFVTEKNLVSLNIKDGKVLWQADCTPQNRFYNAATPVIKDQTIILTGQGSGTKAIKVQKSGDKYITTEVWNNPELGTKYCTPVINGGYLYGVSDKRKVYCMDAAEGKTAWVDTTMNSDFGSFINCGSVIMATPGKTDLIVLKPDKNRYSQTARYKVSDNALYAHPIVTGNSVIIKDKDSVMLFKIN